MRHTTPALRNGTYYQTPIKITRFRFIQTLHKQSYLHPGNRHHHHHQGREVRFLIIDFLQRASPNASPVRTVNIKFLSQVNTALFLSANTECGLGVPLRMINDRVRFDRYNEILPLEFVQPVSVGEILITSGCVSRVIM